MNQRELEGKYARLLEELASPAVTGEHSKAWQARLAREVDQLDLQLAVRGRLARTSTTFASRTGAP